MPLSWTDRIQNYNRVMDFPESLFVAGDGRVVGTWILGNDYRVKSGYHGGYPATFLRRVRALFPDKQYPLHLFSGRVDTDVFPGDTVDMNPALNPTFVENCETLHRVPIEDYDLVLADPPYSGEDADHYGTPMVARGKVMDTLQRVSRGTHVVILDQVLWQWNKEEFELQAAIGIVRSTNHRFRLMTVFWRI
jgi:hypothetical protein